ncbi:MAG: DUF3311 domain-containing protein [Halanaeroarchaeum sp.]
MRRTALVWAFVFLLLAALAVPWFMWGSSTVVAGLPIWVWWHVGWLALTSAVFYWFTRTDWGVGMGTGRGSA